MKPKACIHVRGARFGGGLWCTDCGECLRAPQGTPQSTPLGRDIEAAHARARGLLGASRPPMEDQAVIDAMERLVLLATSHDVAHHLPYAQLTWDLWVGVREYVASFAKYAEPKSGVRRGVPKKPAKKGRR